MENTQSTDDYVLSKVLSEHAALTKNILETDALRNPPAKKGITIAIEYFTMPYGGCISVPKSARLILRENDPESESKKIWFQQLIIGADIDETDEPLILKPGEEASDYYTEDIDFDTDYDYNSDTEHDTDEDECSNDSVTDTRDYEVRVENKSRVSSNKKYAQLVEF